MASPSSNACRLAWAAGFIDGEGCVYIGKSQKGHYFLQFEVVQVRLSPLEELADLFGGTIREDRDRWGLAHRWQLKGARARDALVAIRPYLKLKGEHADLAIKFQAPKKMGRVPDYEQEERDRQRMKELNANRKRLVAAS